MNLNKIKISGIILFAILFVTKVEAQHSKPDCIIPFKFSGHIKFDGILSDSVWEEANRIRNFTQRELNYGQPASEKTEVAVLYDNHALYFGVWCYQKNNKEIVAKFMNTDFDYEADDNFQIVLSPFNDNRTGYLFAINPNGARTDIQISGIEDGNEDWNGVWDARTTITDEGWFAEIYIPFSTLQFKSDSILSWAINFERDIVSKNEQDLWQGWSRDNSIFAVVNAGRLQNLTNIAYARKFEFKPYLLFGRHSVENQASNYPVKTGADLNINITPTLKLNLTTYTDFAQVESDRIPVNLSRFSVYYPEKRQFFLEGSDYFNFYLGENNFAFYSREIGIEEGRQIPIIMGARLFGKVGKHNLGFLNMQESSLDSISKANNTVLRYRYELGKQSTIGGILTNIINTTHSNQVIGIDASYETSEFLNNRNLIIAANIASSATDFNFDENALVYRFYLDYPNDLIDNFMSFGSMQQNFNPELGYIRRTNYNTINWNFRLTPRVLTKYGIKKLALKPWGLKIYNTQSTGELESFSNEIRPIGAEFKSGERFEFNYIQNFDRLDEGFELTDIITIPIGKYWMYNYEVQIETYQSRRIWLEFVYNQGDFYSGKIKTFDSELGINVNKHLNLSGTYTFNSIFLQQNKINTHEVVAYVNYSFNTRINMTAYGQFNSLEDVIILNFRLHWIPKIGSDLYLVYNTNYNEPIKQVEFLKPQTTSAALKLIYRIAF